MSFVKGHADVSDERSGEKRKARMKIQASRKEPIRSEYATQREFETSWQKWRASRDNNNNSVKRSRQQLRMEQMRQDQLCSLKSSENEQLESQMHSLHTDANILIKAIARPFALSKEERDRVKMMMLEEQAKDPEAVAPPSASGLMSTILEDSVLFPI